MNRFVNTENPCTVPGSGEGVGGVLSVIVVYRVCVQREREWLLPIVLCTELFSLCANVSSAFIQIVYSLKFVGKRIIIIYNEISRC